MPSGTPALEPPGAAPAPRRALSRPSPAVEETGLTPQEASALLATHGPNRLDRVRGPSHLLRFAYQFTHVMALLLWAGGAVAMVAGMPQLAVAVWSVNLINGVFSYWQEFRAERAAEALHRLLPRHARVMRGGQELNVPAEDLVPGDLLLLAEGDHVSADARILFEAELRVDQSILTGESQPVRKSASPALAQTLADLERPDLVFAGSSVSSGRGRAVVVATGMGTHFGALARLTQAVVVEPSPLQLEMARVSKTVTAIAVSVGAVFFLLSVQFAGMPLAQGVIFSLGMIVAFVPEGLLPTVTLALALGVQRMAARNALMKKLSAVETLGCTTVICTDKTGTLTQNEMTVRELWWDGQARAVLGTGYAPEGQIDGPLPERLLRAGALCNDARLLPPEPGVAGAGWTVLGDPTEAALLVLARKGGLDPEAEARRSPRLAEIPFESRRKRMSTLHPEGDEGVRVYVKGSPREVLALCQEAGDAAFLERALAAQDRMAGSGLRVLAVAERLLPALPEPLEAAEVERDLTFLGLVGMLDPPRPEVADAVARCHRAGIRIIMVTGDYGLTAESVARRIGIVGPGSPRIITGANLEGMDEAALTGAVAGEVIFARVAPEQKLRVVQALQAAGHVVAVTGDGVNDAPALRRADIGVAMGRSGSDVAREAADLVLADDSFASIVYAIEEGRAVYDNLRRFVSYIFTSNSPEAVPFVLHALSGGRIPLALTVMQVLSVDLGTDMVPALALGAEPSRPEVMDRPPRDRRQPLITAGLLVRSYLWLGMVQALASMSAFLFLFRHAGVQAGWLDLPGSGPLYASATTLALAAVVSCQIGNLFVHRAGGRNPWIAWGVASEVAFLLALTYLPFLNRMFGTAPVPLAGWLYVLAWMPALFVAETLRRLVKGWWLRCRSS